MPRVIGTDPGLKGALVCIDTDAGTIACEPMPLRQVKRSGKYKSVIDEEGLCRIVLAWGPALAGIVEDVYSMANEGHAGAFTFGEGKGMLLTAFAAYGVPRHRVAPQKWKRDLGVGLEGVLITARCNQLFPGCERLLKSEGKREAAMITLWGCLSLGLAVGRLTPVFDTVAHTGASAALGYPTAFLSTPAPSPA